MHSTFLLSGTAETLLFEQPVTNVFWPRIQLYQDRIVYVTIVTCMCHRILSKSQGCPVFHFSIRVLSTLFAPSEVSTVLFFHGTAPLQSIESKFYFHRKRRFKTKTRKPKKSAPDNGGHLVREGRRFYRTYHISVGFDRRTDILSEVCYDKTNFVKTGCIVSF